MKIKDKIDFSQREKPFTLTTKDTVKQALDAMCEQRIGSVVVVDDAGKVAGIVTERDMMTRVLHAKLTPSRTKLDKIMTTDVHVANENDELIDWLRVMSHERFRRLPIINDHGELVTLISQGDLVAYTWPDLLTQTRKNLKKQLGWPFQIAMIVVAIVMLGLIALGYR